MSEILRKKNLTTKLQILVDVATNQPDVQQRDIATRLEISPQAVSDYVRELLSDGWLASDRRSRYQVTPEGVDWIIRELKELQRFSETIQKAISSLSVCAALADCDIEKSQRVGLEMKGGLLFATANTGATATGAAMSRARKGDDVGVSDIEGLVTVEVGTVTILRVPSIRHGGSRRADLDRLRKALKGDSLVGAVGLEALAAARRLGVEPTCLYGVSSAVVEAARSGLSPVVICVEDDAPDLIRALEGRSVQYELRDARKRGA